MRKLVELTLADGKPLDLPASSFSMLEGMHRAKNPGFPEARSFLRYTIGTEDRTALLTDTFDELVALLGGGPTPFGWVILTREDGDRVAVQAERVLAREGVETETGACKLTLSFGAANEIGTLVVREARDEVKAQMEREPVEPASTAEAPAKPRAKRARATPFN